MMSNCSPCGCSCVPCCCQPFYGGQSTTTTTRDPNASTTTTTTVCEDVILSECIVYNGTFLTEYGINPGDTLADILNLIAQFLCVCTSSTTTTTSTSTTSTSTTSTSSTTTTTTDGSPTTSSTTSTTSTSSTTTTTTTSSTTSSTTTSTTSTSTSTSSTTTTTTEEPTTSSTTSTTSTSSTTTTTTSDVAPTSELYFLQYNYEDATGDGKWLFVLTNPLSVNVTIEGASITAYSDAGCTLYADADNMAIGDSVVITAGNVSNTYTSVGGGVSCTAADSYKVGGSLIVNGISYSSGSVVNIGGTNVTIFTDNTACNTMVCV